MWQVILAAVPIKKQHYIQCNLGQLVVLAAVIVLVFRAGLRLHNAPVAACWLLRFSQMHAYFAEPEKASSSCAARASSCNLNPSVQATEVAARANGQLLPLTAAEESKLSVELRVLT